MPPQAVTDREITKMIMTLKRVVISMNPFIGADSAALSLELLGAAEMRF